MEGLFLVFTGKFGEECLPSASHTPREGRGAQTQTSCRGSGVWAGFSAFYIHLSFFPTHICSTESVDEGLSFSSGGLWSNTMVSVLARQNPLERMISKSDRGGDAGVGRRLHPCCKTPAGADLIS